MRKRKSHSPVKRTTKTNRNFVNLVEVGMRDGLQNEKVNLSPAVRFELAQQLLNAGVKRLEIGAFVSPKWVPQMSGTAELIESLKSTVRDGESSNLKEVLSVLVPNEIGMNEAIKHQVKEVAVFTGCSESFVKKNINCSIDQSFDRFIPIFKAARRNGIRVRGYLSTCFGCPYEGPVPESRVVSLTGRLLSLGAYEVSIGDTIGVANPRMVTSLLKKLKTKYSIRRIAGHFHDTHGMALANILAALQLGVRTFDASIGGLGGCPYAPGSSGNVATEDVLNMLNGMKFDTAIDLQKLVNLNIWLEKEMNKKLGSKYVSAEIARQKAQQVVV